MMASCFIFMINPFTRYKVLCAIAVKIDYFVIKTKYSW